MTGTTTGPWRQPTNTSADEKGGIHDDDTAQDLGFQGGTIAGSVHMEQFPPLLVEHFGERWWARGGMSLYFRHATVDREPVRCLLEPTSENRARIWMENEAGDLVMDCYRDGSRYGGRVAPVAPFVHAFRGVEPHVVPVRGPYVGLFGSIEIVWYTATLSDPASGGAVARMTKMDRLMKDASPLWSAA